MSIAERLTKVWGASTVIHNGLTVYTARTSSSILPGYSVFMLDLSSSTVKLIDLGGRPITGSWEISSDGKSLILKNLLPEPDGTDGTINYTIDSITDMELTLTRTTANAKAGGQIAKYVLMVK